MATTLKIGDKVTLDPEAGFPRTALGKVYEITAVPRGANGVNYHAKALGRRR